MEGTITKGIGGFYYVNASGSIYECRARGIFRKQKITPMIGDRVRITVNGKKGSVDEILERRSFLLRPPAANIDMVIVVIAAASPDPNLTLTDKMLINASISGIEPALCINKTDITERNDIENIYKNAGYRVFSVSAATGRGIDELESFINDKITAFAGISGVGKSSILSLITGSDLKTGGVSDKIQRGKHTTRHVELFTTEGGGYVMDTPGFGNLEIEGVRASELWRYFPEMSDTEGMCRFRGCSHIKEPDCAVRQKVSEGKIAPSRYESYKELYEGLKTVKEWDKK